MQKKTTTEMLKNKVFLAEDMQRLYFVRDDHEIHSYSLSDKGVILQVIGNSIFALAADAESLQYYDSDTSPNVPITRSELVNLQIQFQDKIPTVQAQLAYIEKSRTLDLIVFGDIEISFNSSASLKGEVQRNSSKGREVYQFEMLKFQTSTTSRTKIAVPLILNIYRQNNNLIISKLG